jgi:hypothetical protein
MHLAQQKARWDWLVELGGAAALAAAAGYAALKGAPSLGFAAPMAMTAAGFTGFASGAVAMRLVSPAPRRLPIGDFAVPEVEPAEQLPLLLLDVVFEEPLLLKDLACEEPLMLEDLAEDDRALLLVDALGKAEPESRVVQLFADQPMPTPGQLRERIDRHLAGAPRHPSPTIAAPDASQALYAALNELKRSLR